MKKTKSKKSTRKKPISTFLEFCSHLSTLKESMSYTQLARFMSLDLRNCKKMVAIGRLSHTAKTYILRQKHHLSIRILMNNIAKKFESGTRVVFILMEIINRRTKQEATPTPRKIGSVQFSKPSEDPNIARLEDYYRRKFMTKVKIDISRDGSKTLRVWNSVESVLEKVKREFCNFHLLMADDNIIIKI